jgi:putative transposase
VTRVYHDLTRPGDAAGWKVSLPGPYSATQRALQGAGGRGGEHGRPRTLDDNVFVQRLWRTVKYENLYLKAYATVPELELEDGLTHYFDFYCHRRIHQSLDYRTPADVYRAAS